MRVLVAVVSVSVGVLAMSAVPALAAPAGSGLPDGRAFELVSTVGSNPGEAYAGEPYTPTAPEQGFETETTQLFQAAANGERVAYLGEPAVEGGNGATGGGEGNEWLATRHAAGWSTEVITPPASEVGTIYQAFSSNLDSGILQTRLDFGATLTPEELTGCQVLYSWVGGTGPQAPLFSTSNTPHLCGHPLFAGASENESQVIFQSEAALTPEAEEATEVPAGHENGHAGGVGSEGGEPCTFGCNLYESVGGQLRLVNVLPGAGGKTVPNATYGSYAGENRNKTGFSNIISADGSRIFWTDTQEGADMEHVYVDENGETVQVSGAGHAEFWTATRDGHYAYYTEGGELWQFGTHGEAEPRKVLAGKGLKGENAGVQGVIGASEDGSYLYFVATGVLAENEREYENAQGNTVVEAAEPGLDNLYVLHEGLTTFVASLSPLDNEAKATTGATEAFGDWVENLGDRTAEVTPDGTHLVFQSILPLTGYDNADVAEEHPVNEVYVYSAGSAQLACASCAPTGTRPDVHQEENATLFPVSNESDTSMRRWISESGGRVFFDSKQELVPGDTNGESQDVYEWEAEGEGTCTVQTEPRPNHGCVFLLSGGNSEDFSFLVDAGANGNDVFFTHRGPLGQVHTPADQNELYDARVGGGFPNVSLACIGTGCQGVPPAPPLFATPASATFSGPGNPPPAVAPKVVVKALTRAQKLAKALKACAKDRRRLERATCRAQAKRKFGAKTKKKVARKAGNQRRTAS